MEAKSNLNNFKLSFLSKLDRGYGYNKYPEKFKFKFEIKKNIFSNDNFKLTNSDKYLIDLAIKSIKVNSNNIWEKKIFDDREDFCALHRWTWAIKIISKSKRIDKSIIRFIENSILNWCIVYSSNKIEKNNIIFEPYNISERISNYLILIKIGIIKPNKFVLDILENQYLYLLKNIEFYKYKISNHALNNLRAIFLFSSFTNDDKVKKFSKKFIFFLLSKFLDKDGFFRFGSSNYQFIYARWICDIFIFSNKKEIKFKKKIEINLKKIINTLLFFAENNQKRLSIPLFGDISPDISNEWLIKFFFKKNDNFFFRKYWKFIKIFQTKKNVYSYEWLKIKNNKFSVFSRNPKLVGFDFNHSHNDFFNFVIFYKGNPLIIDLGRKNYSIESLKSDLLNAKHNSIIINDRGIYDDYLFFSLAYKFGLKNEKNCKYQVKTDNRSIIKLTSKNKSYCIERIIKILSNKVLVKDKINLIKKSNLKIRFNTNFSELNKISNLEFYNKKNKFKILIDGNCKFHTYKKSELSNYEYGKSRKCKSLFIEFFKKKNISLRTIFEV